MHGRTQRRIDGINARKDVRNSTGMKRRTKEGLGRMEKFTQFFKHRFNSLCLRLIYFYGQKNIKVDISISSEH